jgi:hypothetical protein
MRFNRTGLLFRWALSDGCAHAQCYREDVTALGAPWFSPADPTGHYRFVRTLQDALPHGRDDNQSFLPSTNHSSTKSREVLATISYKGR